MAEQFKVFAAARRRRFDELARKPLYVVDAGGAARR